jgi:hypothetical protein
MNLCNWDPILNGNVLNSVVDKIQDQNRLFKRLSVLVHLTNKGDFGDVLPFLGTLSL